MADMFPQLPDFFGDIDSMVDDTLTNTCTLFDDDGMVKDTQPGSTLFDSFNCTSSIVQVQKTEKSPFHQSDSGVSEVSSCYGTSPSREAMITFDELLDDIQPKSFLMGDNFTHQDEELVRYLEADKECDAGDRFELSTQQTSSTTLKSLQHQTIDVDADNDDVEKESSSSQKVPRVVLRGRRSLQTSSAAKKSPIKESSSENDNSDTEIDSQRSTTKRAPRGSVTVARRGSTLPSNSVSTNCNVTSVKIVRVKSGSGISPEDDVAKALEERNRKNAEMAKLNRLKKKEYIGNLESELEESRQRIGMLEARLNDTEEERDAYVREVEYLKSVLANASALAGLLSNIPNTSGVTLSCASRKRATELDHSYNTSKKSRSSPPSSTAGVCLHVDKDRVSLEFCHHCAQQAAQSSKS